MANIFQLGVCVSMFICVYTCMYVYVYMFTCVYTCGVKPVDVLPVLYNPSFFPSFFSSLPTLSGFEIQPLLVLVLPVALVTFHPGIPVYRCLVIALQTVFQMKPELLSMLCQPLSSCLY